MHQWIVPKHENFEQFSLYIYVILWQVRVSDDRHEKEKENI